MCDSGVLRWVGMERRVNDGWCEVFECAVLFRRGRLMRHSSFLIGMSGRKSHEQSSLSCPCTHKLVGSCSC